MYPVVHSKRAGLLDQPLQHDRGAVDRRRFCALESFEKGEGACSGSATEIEDALAGRSAASSRTQSQTSERYD